MKISLFVKISLFAVALAALIGAGAFGSGRALATTPITPRPRRYRS